MKTLKKLSLIPIVIGVLFLIGLGIQSTPAYPDNMILLVNEQAREYYSPPCLMNDGYDKLENITRFASNNNLKIYREIELNGKGFNPNRECRDADGFFDNWHSLSITILEKIGLYPKSRSRWNADGTWNN